MNKLNEIIVNPKYLKYLYKTTEHEAFSLISTIISKAFHLIHINSHQDDECSYNELPLTTKLNVQADTIATNNARKPINTHLLTSPFAIYVANNYIPHNIDNKIRETSHSTIAKDFFTNQIQMVNTNNKPNQLGSSLELYSKTISFKKTIHKTIYSSSPSNRQDEISKQITMPSLRHNVRQ